MGLEPSGPFRAGPPSQQAGQAPLVEWIGAGLRDRAGARGEKTMRQHQQHRRHQKEVDVAGEGDPPGYRHYPDEGEDRTEGEQHSSWMAERPWKWYIAREWILLPDALVKSLRR